MRVIITGANGFIGSRLAQKYANKNDQVYAIIKDEKENIECIRHSNIHIVYCNIKEIEQLQNHLELMDCDIFFNFAWVGVSTTFKNDFDTQFQNIGYSFRTIQVAHKLRCKKFIGIGSVSEFAYSNKHINGSERPSPCDYYSASKVATRYFCELYAANNGISFNWALLTSIYGPGRNDNNLITYTIKSLLNNVTPEFTKLEQKWDYVYIDDVIEALYLIGAKGHNGKTYTVGSGKERSLKEYVYEIRDLINSGAKLDIGKIPYKTSRVDNSLVDITDLVADTDYHESISFEEGIRRTVEYFRKGLKNA